MLYERNGFYGTRNACTIYCMDHICGTWYAIEGSSNVNFTTEEITEGINVESVEDNDYFEADQPIESLQDMQGEVEHYISGEDEEEEE